MWPRISFTPKVRIERGSMQHGVSALFINLARALDMVLQIVNYNKSNATISVFFI